MSVVTIYGALAMIKMENPIPIEFFKSKYTAILVHKTPNKVAINRPY